jgi:hypothetical protein
VEVEVELASTEGSCSGGDTVVALSEVEVQRCACMCVWRTAFTYACERDVKFAPRTLNDRREKRDGRQRHSGCFFWCQTSPFLSERCSVHGQKPIHHELDEQHLV